MRLYIDDQELNITQEEYNDWYVGEGSESEVLRYGDKALKIYKPRCAKCRLKEDDCHVMKSISTKRILLPRGVLYDENHQFNGFYTLYKDSYFLGHVYQLKRDAFLDKLRPVYGDIRLLSDHRISIEDFHLDNFCYNGEFFFLDPGSYEFDRKHSIDTIYSRNMGVCNRFFTRDLFGNVPGLTRRNLHQLKKHFEGVEDLEDILICEADPDETIKKYVKRITS